MQFDYIIVGCGSAGSILAARLSESGRHTVLVVEAGPPANSPWIHLPVGYGKLFHHQHLNWRYQSEPQAGLSGRTDYWPRGRVVGGSGSINAMVYCRGLPADFNDWEAAGAVGWNWQSAQETYQKLETRFDVNGKREGKGAIPVQNISRHIHPANDHYFSALSELQLPRTTSCNGDQPVGGTVYEINTLNGVRYSSAKAFLQPALKRPNLRLITNGLVRRIVMDGMRATGVELDEKGERKTYHAREVILSAGAIGSPVLLQQSGIGPQKLLMAHGVKTVFANDNVGANLQDHIGINYSYRVNIPTLNNVLSPLLGKIRAGLQYLLTRKGPLSLSVNQCGGFLPTNPALSTPDAQLYFNPVSYTTTRKGTRTIINPDPFSGLILGMNPTRPTSRGTVEMRSADPASAPIIQPNSLATEEDRQTAIACARLCARLLKTPALSRILVSAIESDIRQMDNEALLQDFRDRCGSGFHPVSTCRMGQSAKDAVTDAKLRVFGVQNLRVIDASAFPNVTSGNTNAPTMMLAYRAADLILEEVG